MYYVTNYASPVGEITLAANEKGLAGLWIEGQKHFENTLPEEITYCEDNPILNLAKEWLDRYFAGERMKISGIPLAPEGNAFRQEVWKLLCNIPYGETTTYGEIAKKVAIKMGKERMSAQAVGGAVGHNPISIIIPCHRVIGKNGNLTGYAGGIDKKIRLLDIEGAKYVR